MTTGAEDSGTGRPSPLGGRGQERTAGAFALLASVQAALIFTITLIAVPLPHLAREFDIGTPDLIMITAAYGLPFGGLLLFGGRLADRFGGRRMLTGGLGLFALASVTAAFAPDAQSLVAMRFTQGVAAALIAPAALVVVRALFDKPAAFERAMATWGGVSVLGATLGTLMSGAITALASWRWMFAIPVLIAVSALLATRWLPVASGGATPIRPGLDPAGAVLATLGLTIFSYGLIAGGEYPWTSMRVLIALGIGAGMLGAFVAVEMRVRDPLLPPGFLARTDRVMGLVGMLLAAAGSGLLNLLLSLYLQQERHWSPLATTGAFVPFTLALIGTNRAAPAVVARFGAGRVSLAGFVVGAAGLVMLAGMDRDSSFILGMLPGLLLLPVGMSLVFSGSAVLSTANVPPHQAGLAGGVLNTAMELGPTLGVAALMAVAAIRADVVAGYAMAYGAAAAVYFVAALATAVLVRPRAEGRRASPHTRQGHDPAF